MAVFHTHAVAGSLGGILTGFFAEPRLNRLFFGDDPRYIGLAYALKDNRSMAGFRQIGIQLAGIAFIVILNVVVTSAICLIIRVIVPLRLTDEEMEIGDDAVHGEEAYALWEDGEKFEIAQRNKMFDVQDIESRSVQMTERFWNSAWINPMVGLS